MPAEREREVHRKVGFVIALRLGDPASPHVLSIARTVYDNRAGEMVLTQLVYELVEVTHSSLKDAIDRLSAVVAKAKPQAEEGLGYVVVAVDVTRQPQAYKLIHERVDVSVYVMVTTHGRLVPSTPYWLIGRITVLSHLNTVLARGLVSFARPGVDDPRFWTPEQVREALGVAAAKPPKMTADEYVTEASATDDAALSVALAAMYAEMSPPDPWLLPFDERPIRALDMRRVGG